VAHFSAEELEQKIDRISLEELITLKLERIIDKLKRHEYDGLYHTVITSVEKTLICIALKKNQNHKSKTAAFLGINRNTLSSKIKELKIDVALCKKVLKS
jgi:DNA-binding protein Fis